MWSLYRQSCACGNRQAGSEFKQDRSQEFSALTLLCCHTDLEVLEVSMEVSWDVCS